MFCDLCRNCETDFGPAPQCFAIPGNHDWFDGLNQFMRNIVFRDWLGGWILPQDKSYFALKLPHGWWFFGLDIALAQDIDVHQLRYFAELAHIMEPNDRVILASHAPDWIANYVETEDAATNIYHLQNLLGGRVGEEKNQRLFPSRV